MSKIVEYLFEAFLIIVFCTALANWFVGNDNINSLIDLTKETVEADREVVNTSRVQLDDEYGNYLAVVPFDTEYTIDEMKEFIEMQRGAWVGNTEDPTRWVSMGDSIGEYNYIRISGKTYKKDGTKFILQ